MCDELFQQCDLGAAVFVVFAVLVFLMRSVRPVGLNRIRKFSRTSFSQKSLRALRSQSGTQRIPFLLFLFSVCFWFSHPLPRFALALLSPIFTAL